MRKWVAGMLVAVVVLALAPTDAGAGGRYYGGGGYYWGYGAGLFIGGLALGAALTAPYRYPYPGYPYYGYGPSYYYAPAPAVVYQSAPATYATAPAVQREVVYPNGKYVLYGDGATQPWQWVWVPTAPPPPPPPAR